MADALTRAVAVEHQVVYGYGVAGAHLAGADRRRALAALDAHSSRRDQLIALTRAAAGAVAPAAAPAYALPFPVTTPTAARSLCALLEDGASGAAWDLAAASAPRSPARSLAVGWLAQAATSAAGWRGRAAPTPTFPGQPR